MKRPTAKKEGEVNTSTSVQHTQKDAKKTHVAEIDRFVGPVGAIAMMVGMPLLAQFLTYGCLHHQCNEISAAQALLKITDFKQLYFTLFPNPSDFVIKLFFGYWAIQLALYLIIPGYYYLGFECTDGSRLWYKVNGLTTTFITLAAFFGSLYFGYLTPSMVAQVHDRMLEVVAFSHYVHTFVCFFFLFKGFLFKQGNPSGNPIVDFFYGYELNPRLFGIAVTDFKWFVEGRALCLWLVMAFFLATKQYFILGYVSNSMLLCCFFHFVYIIHYYIHETNVLAMVDFTSEHHGWMLQWGNGVLVPFVYCMPEWYCLKNIKELPLWLAGAFLALYGLGYLIFSQANLQKKQFREDPSKPIWGKKPKVLTTSSGRTLLLSGWWGIGRKMNYTGDLIQALCYGLPCLALSVTPFINSVFLTSLLIQRERRDSRFCKEKYGKDWDEYCKAVPYRMIPYIY